MLEDGFRRYFIDLSYDGTDFCGWQIQPSIRTVQGDIERALSTITRREIGIVGAGRTDTGVHARHMQAHVDLPMSPDEVRDLIFRANRILSPDVVLHSIREVTEEGHARFSALSRTYRYYVGLVAEPFLRKYQTVLPIEGVDFGLMNEAAKVLVGKQDFMTFSKKHSNVFTHICDVSHAEWHQIDEKHWYFEITADRFLRNMVRSVVGTLFEVGRHKVSVQEFGEKLMAQDRAQAGNTAYPQGLFLEEIVYPESIFVAETSAEE